MSVSGNGFEVEELVEAAGSLRVATDDEWDALLEATRSLVPRDALAGVSTVDDDDGDTYGVYIDADDGLCVALESEVRLGDDVLGSDRHPHPCEHGPARLRPGAPRGLHHPRHTGRGRPPPRRRSVDSAPANSEDGTLLATTLTDDELSSQVQVVGSDGTVLGEVAVEAPPEGQGGSSVSRHRDDDRLRRLTASGGGGQRCWPRNAPRGLVRNTPGTASSSIRRRRRWCGVQSGWPLPVSWTSRNASGRATRRQVRSSS